MTPDDFRRLALSFDGAEEGAHMGHADFRVGGRIFATLGSPNGDYGMVQLLPEQQAMMIDVAPQTFKPAAGAWGAKGSTLVRLAGAGEWLPRAMRMAWENRAAAGRARR